MIGLELLGEIIKEAFKRGAQIDMYTDTDAFGGAHVRIKNEWPRNCGLRLYLEKGFLIYWCETMGYLGHEDVYERPIYRETHVAPEENAKYIDKMFNGEEN